MILFKFWHQTRVVYNAAVLIFIFSLFLSLSFTSNLFISSSIKFHIFQLRQHTNVVKWQYPSQSKLINQKWNRWRNFNPRFESNICIGLYSVDNLYQNKVVCYMFDIRQFDPLYWLLYRCCFLFFLFHFHLHAAAQIPQRGSK